jgi:hypothetical protein
MNHRYSECGICGARGVHATKECPLYRLNEKQEATSGPRKVLASAKAR